MTEHPIVLLCWEDASIVDDETWVDRKTASKVEPVVFQQVGWLVEITPEHVVLAACISPEIMSARDRIPRGMVRSITKLDPAFGEPFKMPRKRKRT